MPIPLAALAGGAQILGGAIQGVTSIFQNAKARRLAKENVRPTYQIPTEINANLRMAKSRANQGLSPQAYGNALNNIWRTRNAGLSALRDRRSGLAGISKLGQVTNDATLRLDIADANERKDNERFLMGQNQIMAGYKDKAFDWNQRQKFVENADAIRGLYGASRQNFAAGINNIAGGGIMAMYGGAFNKRKRSAGWQPPNVLDYRNDPYPEPPVD